MKRLLTAVLFLTICTGITSAQQNVLPLPLDSGVTVKGNTIQYALPTTALKMTVTVAHVHEYRGYYADYAQTLLGLSNIITENNSYFSLRNVAVEPVEVPDYEHTYLVQLSSQQNKRNLLGALASRKRTTPKIDYSNNFISYSEPMPDFFKNYSDLSFTQEEDAFVETKIIDGVVTQIPSNRTKTVSKTNSQKAQEAADAISKSRKDQYSLISGEQETPYSPETMEMMLQELKQWENNYLSLFTGLKLEDELVYTFYVIPDAQKTTPAFAFNSHDGLSLENLSTASNLYYIDIQPLFENQITRESKAKTTGKISGYRYRKSVPAQVRVLQGSAKFYDCGVINMRQLGDIHILPAKQDRININQLGFVF